MDPFTYAHAKLSVPMNGLFVPLNRVADSLLRFCRPLSFYNNGTVLDLSFSGSTFLFRHRGRNFLLCCRHQLTNADRKPEEIVIILDEAGKRVVGLTPDEVAQTILDSDSDSDFSDLADILIAEYRPRPGGRDLAPHFYPLDLDTTPDLDMVGEGAADPVFAIGFPSADSSYEPTYDEESGLTGAEIVSRWVKLYLKRAHVIGLDWKGMIPLVAASDKAHVTEKPDGNSGSPVFFIYDANAHAPKLGFAGMIVRGHPQGRVNIIPAAQIRYVVNRLIDA